MKDHSKTKQILIQELASLKQKITELERSESERRRTEDVLRRSQQLFSAIFRANPAAVIISSLDDGKCVDANEAYVRLTGYKREELIGKTTVELNIWISSEERQRVVAELAEMGHLENVELTLRRKNGERINTIAGGEVITLEGKCYILSFFLDITDRKRTEEESRLLASVVRHSRELINLATPDGTMVFLNDTGKKMLGISEEDIAQTNIMNVIPVHLQDKVQQDILPSIIRNGYWEGDLQYLNLKTGGLTDVYAILFTITDPETGTFHFLANVSLDITERKQAEEALCEQENKLSSIFRAAPVGIGMVINRVFREANDTLCQMTGYSREELLGQDTRMLYPMQDDYDYVGQEKYRQIGEKSIGSVETRWKRKDGTVIDIILSSTPLNPDNIAKGVTFTALDITDRKRMEEALRQSEANYRQLFDNSPTGIYQVDFRTGKFLKANDVMCKYLGYGQEAISLLSPYDFLTDEGKNLFSDRLKKMMLGEEVVENPEYEIIDKQGKRRWVQLNTKFFYDSAGVAGADVVAHEITDRKLVEMELRESEKRYRALIDFLPISIFEIDTTGIVVSFNHTALKVFRYNEEDFKEGMNALQFFVPKEWQRVGESLKKVIQRTSIPGQEFTFRRKDGSTFIGLIYSSPIIDQNNTIGIRGAIIDITDRKQAEEEKRNLEERLQRSEKMEALGQLAGGVAHDLNNVLGVLSGYSELLLLEIPEGHRSRGHAEKILQSTEKGAAIIQDLLTLARRGVTALEVINLNSCCYRFSQDPRI